MTEFLFGALAFLMALGWGLTNFLTARNHLREANALETAMRVDGVITDRATEIVNRFMALQKRKSGDGKTDDRGLLPNADENAAEQERRRQQLSGVDFATVRANGESNGFGTLGPQPLDEVE